MSTRGRYGLRAVADIAVWAEKSGGVVSVLSIAKRQGISENYLEQIIAPLKKAGYLKSVRGAGGGYALAKPPEEITAGEVLRVLEGSLSPADCLEDDAAACGGASCDKCAARGVLAKIFESLNEVVDSVTIRDIINDISGKDTDD